MLDLEGGCFGFEATSFFFEIGLKTNVNKSQKFIFNELFTCQSLIL